MSSAINFRPREGRPVWQREDVMPTKTNPKRKAAKVAKASKWIFSIKPSAPSQLIYHPSPPASFPARTNFVPYAFLSRMPQALLEPTELDTFNFHASLFDFENLCLL